MLMATELLPLPTDNRIVSVRGVKIQGSPGLVPQGPINASKTLSIDKDKDCGEIQPNGTDPDKAHLTNRKYWKNNKKHRKVWEGVTTSQGKQP